MENDTVTEEQDSTQQKSFLSKLWSFIRFRRPGTKEDLEHEIQELLEEGEEHGLISSLEEKMISSIFDFRETLATEIMTPAAEIVSFDEASPVSELIDIVIDNGLTRIPVYRENPDQVIGVVHAKDLLEFCIRPRKEEAILEKYLRPVHFIPESKLIVDLLPEFQKRKAHMAMITDEFGTIRGLITLEDILEEIVGEIDDEYGYAYWQRSCAQARLENLSDAVKDLEKAVEKSPSLKEEIGNEPYFSTLRTSDEFKNSTIL